MERPRNAREGDKFVVAHASGINRHYSNGDTVTLYHDDGTSCPYFSNGVRDYIVIGWGELEPLEDGSGLFIGSKVIVTKGHYEGGLFYVVEHEIDCDGEIRLRHKDRRDDAYVLPSEVRLATDDEWNEVAPQFSVGDWVIVTGNSQPTHFFSEGALVRVSGPEFAGRMDARGPVRRTGGLTIDSQHVNPSDLRPLTDVESERLFS